MSFLLDKLSIGITDYQNKYTKSYIYVNINLSKYFLKKL